MNKTFMRILRARAKYFAEFASALREELNDQGIEPEDDKLCNVAVQLYAIDEDEAELYDDEDEDVDDDEEDEEEGDW